MKPTSILHADDHQMFSCRLPECFCWFVRYTEPQFEGRCRSSLKTVRFRSVAPNLAGGSGKFPRSRIRSSGLDRLQAGADWPCAEYIGEQAWAHTMVIV
jgi:hypothetical protein